MNIHGDASGIDGEGAALLARMPLSRLVKSLLDEGHAFWTDLGAELGEASGGVQIPLFESGRGEIAEPLGVDVLIHKRDGLPVRKVFEILEHEVGDLSAQRGRGATSIRAVETLELCGEGVPIDGGRELEKGMIGIEDKFSKWDFREVGLRIVFDVHSLGLLLFDELEIGVHDLSDQAIVSFPITQVGSHEREFVVRDENFFCFPFPFEGEIPIGAVLTSPMAVAARGAVTGGAIKGEASLQDFGRGGEFIKEEGELLGGWHSVHYAPCYKRQRSLSSGSAGFFRISGRFLAVRDQMRRRGGGGSDGEGPRLQSRN